MKTITQERILKAHEHYMKYCYDSIASTIVSELATHGLSCATQANTELDNQKLLLELSLLGAFDINRVHRKLKQAGISDADVRANLPKKPAFDCHQAYCLSAWILIHQHLQKHWCNHRNAIKHIQVTNHISGLTDQTIDFGHTILTIKETHFNLELIDSDYKVLYDQRLQLADAFVSAVSFNRMQLYELHETEDIYGEWRMCSTNYVLDQAHKADIVECWSELCFTNHKEMRRKGYTTPRSTPVSPDHEKEWSIFFSCETVDLESKQRNSIGYFCAYLGSSMPCL